MPIWAMPVVYSPDLKLLGDLFFQLLGLVRSPMFRDSEAEGFLLHGLKKTKHMEDGGFRRCSKNMYTSFN